MSKAGIYLTVLPLSFHQFPVPWNLLNAIPLEIKHFLNQNGAFYLFYF